MYQQNSLIAELDEAVRRGSHEKRVDTLRRITDLFLVQKEQLSEQQIEVFDEVLGHLINRMESRALIELSERLAPVNNAPINVVHTLARDDEIAIAGPVLSLSDRLNTVELIEIAHDKGQSHLLAISKRASLSEDLTDALVKRGDQQVISQLAENAGARLSEKSYTYLVDQPNPDQTILEKLGLRLDIPLHIFRRLLERVTIAVRERIMALAGPDKRNDIKEILASISSDVVTDEELDRDFATAKRHVQVMSENGQLDQIALLEFARTRKYAAMVTALAMLCSAPINIIKQLVSDGRVEPLLVPCKVAGLSWLTVRALLQDNALGRVNSEDELKKLKSDYLKLSNSTARKLLDFWSDRQASTQKPSAAT